MERLAHSDAALVLGLLTMTQRDFDAMYGAGTWVKVCNIINDLAPTTRRDEWWASEGPYEILAMHLMSSGGEQQDSGGRE